MRASGRSVILARDLPQFARPRPGPNNVRIRPLSWSSAHSRWREGFRYLRGHSRILRAPWPSVHSAREQAPHCRLQMRCLTATSESRCTLASTPSDIPTRVASPAHIASFSVLCSTISDAQASGAAAYLPQKRCGDVTAMTAGGLVRARLNSPVG
ncbi:hypothetical protein BKA93DRAFT_551427 [Sparassis latifolia]